MSTLIIGAGLVGSQVANILVERGERPILMDYAPQPEALAENVELAKTVLIEGDVLKPFSISQAIVQHGITRIVHTAANPLLTLGAQRDPWSAIQLNVTGTVNVLEAARVHGIKRVVVSSSNVLNHFLAGGEGAGDSADEEAFPRPTTFYSATKQTIENIGLNYARWAGVDFAALRYGAVFGPWSGRGGGGPSNIVRGALETALAGAEAAVPTNTMEWVYSKDAALGTVLALDAADLGSRVFNITMGCVVGPDEFAAALSAAVPGARLRPGTPAASAVSMPDMRCVSRLDRARKVLGYEPRFGMQAAMVDMIAWLRRARKAA
jgi:nucleoside-diphosphate-sugar epimerase